jgi:RHS repeat-associated protein
MQGSWLKDRAKWQADSKRNRYSGWGDVVRTELSQTSNSHGHYGYTGQEYDEEAGLLYLRARYYDPNIGRFISADPFWGRLEEPASQNRYAYVHNNPLVYADPSGLDSIRLNIGIGLGPGIEFGVDINTSTGDVFLGGGIGVGVGLSGTATYSTATPSENFLWNFELAGGTPVGAGGSISGTWDASAYENTGTHQPSSSASAGVGFGAGLSATGTFGRYWNVGNLGESLNWWLDLFGFSSADEPSACP